MICMLKIHHFNFAIFLSLLRVLIQPPLYPPILNKSLSANRTSLSCSHLIQLQKLSLLLSQILKANLCFFLYNTPKYFRSLDLFWQAPVIGDSTHSSGKKASSTSFSWSSILQQIVIVTNAMFFIVVCNLALCITDLEANI